MSHTNVWAYGWKTALASRRIYATNKNKLPASTSYTRSQIEVVELRIELWTFYAHAISSVTDYSAPCLCSLMFQLLAKFEAGQNDALRVIMGAPNWCCAANFQAESGLPSLPQSHTGQVGMHGSYNNTNSPGLPISTQLVQELQLPTNDAADRLGVRRCRHYSSPGSTNPDT